MAPAAIHFVGDCRDFDALDVRTPVHPGVLEVGGKRDDILLKVVQVDP